MKKLFCIILSIIILVSLTSCGKALDSDIDSPQTQSESMKNTHKKPRINTLLDYAVTPFYNMVQEFGKYILETPRGGTVAYFENRVEVILGQLDNISGKEKPIGINSHNPDIPVTDTLDLSMTFDEINKKMGGTIEIPTFSEDSDDGYTSYSTVINEENFTIYYYWSVDSANQVEYNARGADYVCVKVNDAVAQSYDGDMFSTLSKEEAKNSVDPSWYIGSTELLDVGNFYVFFDNVKYYHFVLVTDGNVGNDAFVSSEGGHFYVGSFRDGESDIYLYIDENTTEYSDNDVFLNPPFTFGGTFESGTIYGENVASRRYYYFDYYDTVKNAY